MLYHVTVSFGKDKQYQFRFSQAELAESTPEEARRWFDKEFADLQCEASNPMGKVLSRHSTSGIEALKLLTAVQEKRPVPSLADFLALSHEQGVCQRNRRP